MPWASHGITETLVRRMVAHANERDDLKACHAVLIHIKGGVVSATYPWMNSHPACAQGIVRPYPDFLERVAALVDLPDSLFMVHASDHTDNTLSYPGHGDDVPVPFFHFCRTREAHDILIEPYLLSHIGTEHRRGWGSILNNVMLDLRKPNSTWAWNDKSPIAFATWTTVRRAESGGMQAVLRRDESGTVNSEVRATLEQLVQDGSRFNASRFRISGSAQHVRLPMVEWGQFRYVVFTDGITCSNKLFELLLLGSLILVEQSGYECLARTTLRPFVHYVPFWENHPQELADAVQWAVDNDADARRIAEAGRDWAHAHLNVDALACRWKLLLTEYNKLLRFNASDEALVADIAKLVVQGVKSDR
jgi:hypothetical protein